MQVIDQINGSALFAQSAFSAYVATKDSLGRDITATYLTAINIPESATWNDVSETVQTNSAQWSQGGTTYTSPSGTILINGDTLEGTNSAISIVGYEGFVSSYGSRPVGPNDTARYTWDKALPNTIITLDTRVNSRTLYWSANTDLTGETVLPETGNTTLSISIPNATAFATWSNKYFNLNGATVSAADTLGTTVGELAWASALPTYEYDNTNKISAINGSALAGGDMFTAYLEYNDQNQISGYAGSAFAGQGGGGNPEVENYVQTNSANIDDTVTSYQTNSGTFLTAHQAISAEEWNDCYDNVNTNSGAWGGSALPISAGPGIKVNLVDNTLVFSNDETVLWENSNGVSEDTGFTISEPFTNFERIRYIGRTNNCNYSVEVPVYSEITAQFRFGVACMCPAADGAPLQIYGKSLTSNNGLTYIGSRSEARWFDYNSQTSVNGTQPFWGLTFKVVGINRK